MGIRFQPHSYLRQTLSKSQCLSPFWTSSAFLTHPTSHRIKAKILVILQSNRTFTDQQHFKCPSIQASQRLPETGHILTSIGLLTLLPTTIYFPKFLLSRHGCKPCMPRITGMKG